MNALCHVVSLCKDVWYRYKMCTNVTDELYIIYKQLVWVYILNLVYNIVIYNEFSYCLLYNLSHFSLLLGRMECHQFQKFKKCMHFSIKVRALLQLCVHFY